MSEQMAQIRSQVQATQPLIHCITNPISINLCANGLLAIGARPIMAEHPKEVAEITKTAAALVLNLGNITDVRMDAMRHSAEAATEQGIPVVLDLVGISCSGLRREFALRLLDDFPALLIKGNYSEIRALLEEDYRSLGVDAAGDITAGDMVKIAKSLALQRNSIILASGAVDIISDGETTYRMENGSPKLAGITGTGCLLGVLCGGYLSVAPSISAAELACTMLGVAGEESAGSPAGGSFQVALIDQLELLSDETLNRKQRKEEVR